MKVEEASYLFKVLSDQGRLNIVKTLYQFKELCANDLLMAVQCKQATLSHHMSVLTESGLVDSYKDGNKVFYSINKKRVNAVVNFLCSNKIAFKDKEEPKEEEKPVVVEVKPAKEEKPVQEPVKQAPVKPAEEQKKPEPVKVELPTFLL